MRDLVASTWMRAFTGKVWWTILVGGVAACALAASGFAMGAGDMTPQEATDGSARLWFTMLLFCALFTANCVTRDVTTGAVARAALASGNRWRLFWQTVVVSTLSGVVYGLVAAACAAATPFIIAPAAGFDPQWTSSTNLAVLGVFVVTVLAGPWGAVVGWMVRSQVGAIGIILVQVLLVDELVQRLVPAAGKYALTMAMASVYGEGRPGLLPVVAALAVILFWLGAGGAAGYLRTSRRDVL